MVLKTIRTKTVYISMGITALLMLFFYIIKGVYPFGDGGVEIVDSVHQYLPLLTDLREKLLSGESLFYSFAGGFGYNLWGTIAYYMACPFNILLVFVPMEHVIDFMSYLTIFKIAVSAGTFAWYLGKRNEDSDYWPIPFAMMYAFSSYIIGYYFNIMWLDSIMIFPLVMEGIESLVKKKKGKLYCLSLFYCIFCNYYIGFMICIFSCLYFGVQMIIRYEHNIKRLYSVCLRFLGFSALAGGMSACLLIPAYIALTQTVSAGQNLPEKVEFYTDWLDQLSAHFALVKPVTTSSDSSEANLYCGCIVLILILLYILDKQIRRRERLAKLTLLAFIFVSTNCNILNFIWHGFHYQAGVPNRFTFLYIALILSMAFETLKHIHSQSYVRLMISIVIPLLFIFYCFVTKTGEYENYVYFVTNICLTVYSVLILLVKGHSADKKMNKVFTLMLCLAMVSETTLYGYVGWHDYVNTITRSFYVDTQISYQQMEKDMEKGFYRTDSDGHYMRNESMFLGAKGVSLFSSTISKGVTDFCKNIGMFAGYNVVDYRSNTQLFDDIFGIRYLISRTDADSLYQMNKVTTILPMTLYENEDALSVGFMVSDHIKEWNINDTTEYMETQEKFVEYAVGIPFTYTQRNVYAFEEGPRYVIDLKEGEQTYIFLEDSVKELKVSTPQHEVTFNAYTTHLCNLGMAKEGQDNHAYVELVYKEDSSEPVITQIYTCLDSEYEKVYEQLADEQLKNVQQNGNILKGNIDVETAGTLFLTIPYDEGWTIYVDGKETQYYCVGNAFLGVDLTEGNHDIYMKYVPCGFYAGAVISLLCLIFFVSVCIKESKCG